MQWAAVAMVAVVKGLAALLAIFIAPAAAVGSKRQLIRICWLAALLVAIQLSGQLWLYVCPGDGVLGVVRSSTGLFSRGLALANLTAG
jgi:hypothetical protein